MKVLLDSCVWGKAKTELATLGHDVDWCGDWPVDPGDREILRRAHSEQRILVTLDRDFGELAIVFRQAHSGIIRLSKVSAREQASAVHRILLDHPQELLGGAIVSRSDQRTRVRRPDSATDR